MTKSSKVANTAKFQNIVSASVLALMLGVTEGRVRQLVVDGLPKHAYGGYDLYQCIQWILQRERSNKSDAYTKKRTSLIEAQRNKVTIETQILRGNLIPYDDHQALVNELASIVATQLDGVASRIADAVTGNTNRAEVQNILLRELRGVRRAIADQIETGPHKANSGGDHTATA